MRLPKTTWLQKPRYKEDRKYDSSKEDKYLEI